MKLRPVHFVMLLCCVLWASFFTLTSTLMRLDLVSTTGVTFVQRFATFAALSIPFLLTPREKRVWERRHWPPIIVVATLLTSFTYLYYWAYRHYDQGVANSTVLWRTDIIFAILMGRVLFGERIAFREVIALVGMVTGVFMITETSPTGFRFHLVGDLLVVTSAFLMTCNAYIIQRLLKPCPNAWIAFINNGVSLCLLSLVYLFLQAKSGTLDADIAAFRANPWFLGLCALLGLIGSCVFLTYYFALQRLAVWQVRAFMLFVPFFAAPLAYLVPTLRETLSALQVCGMVLVTGFGLWLMDLTRRQAEALAEAEQEPAQG